MTDPITLTAGEAKYPLNVGVNAICDIEEAFGGISILAVIAKFANGAPMLEFRTFLRTTLRSAEGKRLSDEGFNMALEAAGVEAAMLAVAAAIRAIMATVGAGAATAADRSETN